MEIIKPGYTRVSSIVGQWNTFGAIKDKPFFIAKCELGTRVHEAIENDINGIFHPLDEAAKPYFESFEKWAANSGAKFVANEQRFYDDKYMITGKFDSLIKMPGEDKFILVDYKTSSVESKLTWQLQGCFYHYLATQAGFDLSDRMLFLKLDKDGGFPKVCEYTFSKKLWSVCVSAYNCYRYMNKI